MSDFSDDINQALTTLQSGGVILYPTDTVWGIGCDATLPEAISRIFSIKHRNPNRSMIILVADADMIHQYVNQPSAQLIGEMTKASSPTTGIFENARNLPKNLINHDGSIAIRIASDLFCSELIAKLSRPIVSTSANLSQKGSPQNFSEIDPVLLSEVDYTVFYRREDLSEKDPSHIIRLDGQGYVERVR